MDHLKCTLGWLYILLRPGYLANSMKTYLSIFVFYTMLAEWFDIVITTIHIVYFMICFCAKISNDINCASYYSAIINYTSALDRMQCPIKSYSWKNRAISTNWPIFYLFMLRYTLEKKENVSTIRMRFLANIRNRNKVNYRVERD